MSERTCIKCGQGMKPKLVEEVEVDCCQGCGGLWLDHGEIRQLAAKPDDTLLKVCPKAREEGDEAASTVDEPCPACGGKMTLAIFDILTIERCGSCHGIFLDRGELDKAVEIVRGRGDKIATILALARSVATHGEINA